jgi:hypothetical protein
VTTGRSSVVTVALAYLAQIEALALLLESEPQLGPAIIVT